MSAIDPKAKKSFIILGSVITGIFVLAAVFFMLARNKVEKSDAIAKMPRVDLAQASDKGDQAGNPTEAYAGMSKTLDDKKAEAAANSGGASVPSFAPPPEDVKPAPGTSSPQGSTPYGQQPAQQPQYQQQAYAESNRLTDIQNKRMEDKLKRLEQMAETFKTEGYASVKESSGWISASHAPGAAASSVAAASAGGDMIIKTGEHAYVSIDTAINTDEPSVVLGTILSGNAYGWQVFGKSQLNADNTISITFDSIALPSGKDAPINAFAIDPKTGRTSVTGSVDHKIFERFILPAVASGMGTYGQITARQGQQITQTPATGTTTSTQNLTVQQVRAAAIGSGVGTIANTLTQTAQGARAAVSTNRNLGLEVVFMKALIAPVK